jgi:protoheme IX farnesyltransferase
MTTERAMTKLSASLGAPPEIGLPAMESALSKPERELGEAGKYLQLTKPGIVFGNLVSVIGGFLMATRGAFDPGLFARATAGVSLVVACGCVFNNYIDRDIDLKMRRTQKRVLARGLVGTAPALLFGGALGLAGLALLASANILSAALGAVGLAIYVGLYSLYLKRRSPLQTLIGSLSGAMPPVIGYCAVSGQFDLGAVLLLLILSLWQMPHSYAIGIVYRDDYAAAGVPVLPVQAGIATARRHILLYIPAFTAAALMLTLCGYTGRAYLLVMTAVGALWMYIGLSTQKASDRVWARRMFAFSILAIMVWSLMISIDAIR